MLSNCKCYKLRSGKCSYCKKGAKKGINKVSKKRAVINKTLYKPIADKVKENQVCAIKSPVCIGLPVNIHHPRGKQTIELLIDPGNMMPCCDPCNGYLEANTLWGKEKGFIKSRHHE